MPKTTTKNDDAAIATKLEAEQNTAVASTASHNASSDVASSQKTKKIYKTNLDATVFRVTRMKRLNKEMIVHPYWMDEIQMRSSDFVLHKIAVTIIDGLEPLNKEEFIQIADQSYEHYLKLSEKPQDNTKSKATELLREAEKANCVGELIHELAARFPK